MVSTDHLVEGCSIRRTERKMIGTQRRSVFGDVDLWTINTYHVERKNLTIRTFMKRSSRLSLGFSKKLENLAAACALHFAYFNFSWRPREKGNTSKLRVTPAMAAGVTPVLWSVEDVYNSVA
jgi:hypothetical protein